MPQRPSWSPKAATKTPKPAYLGITKTLAERSGNGARGGSQNYVQKLRSLYFVLQTSLYKLAQLGITKTLAEQQTPNLQERDAEEGIRERTPLG